MLKLMLWLTVFQAPAEEVWTSVGEEEYPFGHVTDVVQMSDGMIWVADAYDPYHIHVLDNEGRVARRLGREGDGPGELRCAEALARTPDGGAAVLCGHELHFFDSNGFFKRRILLEQLVWNLKDLLVTADEVLVSGALSAGELTNTAGPHAVAVFDRKTGKLIRTMHPSQPSKVSRNSLYVSGGPIAQLENGEVVVANSAPIRIVRYSNETGTEIARDTIVADIADDFTYQNGTTPMGQVLYSHRWYYPRAFYLGLESNGQLLLVTRWRKEEGGVERSVWDWYDSNGDRLRRIDIPVAYEVFDRANDGSYLVRRENELGEEVVVRLRIDN
jgi:hypothetical protein